MEAIGLMLPASSSIPAVVPEKRAGDFNQSLMDIGSTICRPQNPVAGPNATGSRLVEPFFSLLGVDLVSRKQHLVAPLLN